MVRRAARLLARLLAAALLVLPLTACIFVLSPFPATLSQVVAKADLSSVIPPGQGDLYNVYVVTPTGGDFVILLSHSTLNDPVVVVLDSNLDLIQTYGSTQLGPWGFSGGWVALTDSVGDAVIGSLRFSAAELSTVNAAPSGGSIGTSLNGPGFGSPVNGTNEVNFTVSGSQLSYSRYSYWASLGGSTPVQVDAAGSSYWIQGVYNVNDDAAAGQVVLVLSQQGDSSNVTFVSLPLSAVVNNALLSPLLSNYPSKSYANLRSSSIGFAGDSLAGYSQDSGALKRFSLSTLEEISSLPVGRSDNYRIQTAYKATGGWSVVFDPDSLTLQKVANWW